MDYQGKQVVIIGLGLTGLSCLDYFLSQGVKPKIVDTRKKPVGLDKLPPEIEVHVGSLNAQWLLEADLLVVSPGVAISTPEIKAAIDKGVEVVGDIELFCREVNQAKAKIIAITGSNGKSTVTTLVGKMASNARIKTAVGGNIGLPVLSFLEDHYDLYVLELSSFQLETTSSLQSKSATILNISEDHLDRYSKNLDKYVEAKQRIYQNAEVCIYHQGDVYTHPRHALPEAKFIEFGEKESAYRLDKIDGELWLVVENEPFLRCSELKITGRHNYLNALAAVALALSAGISKAVCIETLKHFNGLPHRFQLVNEAHGIKWINDSKATNVGSVIAALDGLEITGKMHLLMGGDSKSANLMPLAPILQSSQKQIYCFGADGDLIKAISPENSQSFYTMEEAMFAARKNAKEGDWIVLSPACASTDQFDNYEQRGRVFTEISYKIA